MNIRIENISKSFHSSNGKRSALNIAHLEIYSGEAISVIGPNGCGKSTLLKIIAGLIHADCGQSVIQSIDIGSEARVSYVAQDYRSTLLPWYSVFENIAFPLKIANVPEIERKSKVEQALIQLEIDLPLMDRVNTLSGGQQQLVCLLRCYLSDPDVLLLDEPFSALDQSAKWKAVGILEKIRKIKTCTSIVISHDIDEAIHLGDRILIMSAKGKIVDSLFYDESRPRALNLITSRKHLKLRSKILDHFTET